MTRLGAASRTKGLLEVSTHECGCKLWILLQPYLAVCVQTLMVQF